MKPAALFLMFTLVVNVSGVCNIPPRVDSFIRKLEIYYDNHPVKWKMPNVKPSPLQEMPSPPIVGMMTLDPQTGLAFSPSTGNLYHPELEVGLEAATGTVVDFKTGKRYELAELLRQSQSRKRT